MYDRESAIECAAEDLAAGYRLSEITRSLAAAGFSPEDSTEIIREAMKQAKVNQKKAGQAERISGLVIGLPIIALGVCVAIFAWQDGMLFLPIGLIGYGIFECLGGRNYIAEYFHD